MNSLKTELWHKSKEVSSTLINHSVWQPVYGETWMDFASIMNGSVYRYIWWAIGREIQSSLREEVFNEAS